MWLYVPNLSPETSSPCALASEGSSSEFDLLSTVSERLVEASASWRGKPQQPQAWSRRWKQGGFIRRLSGLTCSPLMRDRGVASFISSLRAIPVRTTPSPESAPEPMASGFSPPKSAALPPSAGLILSSAKTCRGTLTDNCEPSSQHWKDWATALRQEYSRRPEPETPCDASDFSSWPAPVTSDDNKTPEAHLAMKARMKGGPRNTITSLQVLVQQWAAPQARDHFPPHSPERIAAMKAEGHGMRNLNDEASAWSSPKASDPEKAGPNMRGSKGDVPLPGQAAQWMTPMTADTGQKVTHATKQYSLIQQAERDFHPPSSPDHPIAGGSTCSTDTPNSNQPSVKRKLNPIFVEALMRWPTGLSGFERQETAWTLWWQLQRSYLSALDWGSPDEEAQGRLF